MGKPEDFTNEDRRTQSSIPDQYRDHSGVQENYQQINVDFTGLKSFQTSMGAEVDQNLQPHVEHLLGEYELGTPFGLMTRSPEVDTARTKHHECINNASKTLASYVNASKVLVAAIEQIRQNYAGADALAAGDGAAVTSMLNQALGDADRARAAGADSWTSAQEAAYHGCPYTPPVTEGGHTMNTEPTSNA